MVHRVRGFHGPVWRRLPSTSALRKNFRTKASVTMATRRLLPLGRIRDLASANEFARATRRRSPATLGRVRRCESALSEALGGQTGNRARRPPPASALFPCPSPHSSRPARAPSRSMRSMTSAACSRSVVSMVLAFPTFDSTRRARRRERIRHASCVKDALDHEPGHDQQHE